jgi:hypothetical protein
MGIVSRIAVFDTANYPRNTIACDDSVKVGLGQTMLVEHTGNQSILAASSLFPLKTNAQCCRNLNTRQMIVGRDRAPSAAAQSADDGAQRSLPQVGSSA